MNVYDDDAYFPSCNGVSLHASVNKIWQERLRVLRRVFFGVAKEEVDLRLQEVFKLCVLKMLLKITILARRKEM